MTEEPWNEHTPGDPMPCKCGESVLEVIFRSGLVGTAAAAKSREWGRIHLFIPAEITAWRFIERKGEDVIAADPYDALEWDEDDTAIVVLKEPGQPWWVRDNDLVRFRQRDKFEPAGYWTFSWVESIAFQIKRRPVLTPAEPQLLDLLSEATCTEANAIRSAARRANIKVPG